MCSYFFGNKSNDIMENIIDVVFNTNNNILNKIIKLNYYNNLSQNNFAELKYLLKNFDIDTRNKDGKNLLHIFASNNKNILKILLEHGCNINAKDNLGKTPIFYCNETDYQFFIDNGADVNIVNNFGFPVLYYASKSYFTSIIKPLLDAGADKNIFHLFKKREQLHFAVLFQDTQKIKELLVEDASLINSVITQIYGNNDKYKFIITPITITIQNGFYDEFLTLIEYGEKINPDYLDFSVYKPRFNENHIKILKKLIELGIPVNELTDNMGGGILHSCCDFEIGKYRNEIITILLENGADIHAKTKEIDIQNVYGFNRYAVLSRSGVEPLQHFTETITNIEVYKTLIKYEADINLQNSYGINAFMGLCNSTFFRYCDNPENLYEVVKLFIDNGADIFLKDKFNNTAFDILCENENIGNKQKKKIIQLFQEHAKILFLNPKTNEFIYKLLQQP